MEPLAFLQPRPAGPVEPRKQTLLSADPGLPTWAEVAPAGDIERNQPPDDMIPPRVPDSANLIIIGGGAAGLAAAIFAAETAGPNRRIIVLDGAKALGAKILVSGGGRCNVTHDVVEPADFNGSRHVVRHVLAAFNAEATVRWFAALGVELKHEETGKLFPVTDSASTVLNALLTRCTALGVVLKTSSRVTAVSRSESGDGFVLTINGGEQLAGRAVIFATGGRSLPRSGSDGSGWDIIRTLGHSVTPTHAALVPLVLNAPSFHASLAGISLNVELSTFSKGKLIDRRSGSFLWTHFGISGPVVMDASRHFVIAQETEGEPTLQCNFLHPDQFETVEQWLIQQSGARPKASIGNVLSARLPVRVASALITSCGIDPALPAGQLPREARRSMVHALTALPLPVQQHRGWNYAEVTAGGVPLDEINFRTMESKKVGGVYLSGEILDCDGRIGGFNFQWAWATGYLAGRAAAMAHFGT
jgi:predicted Rossmann fold flavoprotein